MKLLIIVVLALLAACTSVTPFFGRVAPRADQTLYFNNGSEPRSLDPDKTSLVPDGNIIQNIFESLTVYDPKTLAPLPGMAERWEARNDSRTWIFYLRKNARWSDGRAVTAHDFVWAWQRAIAPETASPYSYLLFYIKNGEAIAKGNADKSTLGVRAVDDYTLAVEMERPTAFFVQMTPVHVFAPLPRWAIEQWGKEWTRVGNIVSNGPFLLSEHRPYDQIVLVKNKDYWDAANVKLEKAVFLPVTEQGTNMNLYKAGEVDVMISGLVPQVFTKAVINKRDFLRGPSLQTCYYSFNLKRKPFDDARVRMAFNIAINKQLLTDTLYAGRGITPAYTLTPPGLPNYQLTGAAGFNIEKARQLLAEAGYAHGQGLPKITLYLPTHAGSIRLAEAVQKLWQESLNVKVELQNEEFQTYQARSERRDFDICYACWNGDYVDPNTFLDIYASDNANNHAGWINERYARLITEANMVADDAERKRLLAEAEALLLAEMPIMPIYHNGISYLKKPYIQGWELNLLDQHPLKFVWIDNNWKD